MVLNTTGKMSLKLAVMDESTYIMPVVLVIF